MIEDGLFLGLGFCVATLIALACLPVLWARALRRTRERLSRSLPTSQAEVDAINDGFRAQAAVALRRLEQRRDAEQHAAATVKADLGRRTVNLVAAERAAEALRTERGTLLAELDDHARDRRDGDGQRAALEKALHDADTQAEAALAEAAETARQLDSATSLGEERRATIAALEIRTAGLRAEVQDGQDRLAALEAVAAQHAKAEMAAEAAFELKRNEAERLKTSVAALQQALQQERRNLEERDRLLQQRSDTLAAAETRMTEQDALITQRQAELAAFKLRIEALEAELRTRADGGTADLRAAGHDDALLRSAIVAVGVDALRLLEPPDEGRQAPDPEEASQAGTQP